MTCVLPQLTMRDVEEFIRENLKIEITHDTDFGRDFTSVRLCLCGEVISEESIY